MKLCKGDQVKLRRGVIGFRRTDEINHTTAAIAGFFSDIEGGVILDRRIGGCRCWNVLDLEPAVAAAEKSFRQADSAASVDLEKT